MIKIISVHDFYSIANVIGTVFLNHQFASTLKEFERLVINIGLVV
ncbi:hypothetical protein [Mongoliitalea daihaiensis]|nr:hypothetical protein [Mongoliitalea daihaiensis]